ncbi:MAG: alpha/beta hydrolase [Erysipelotrichaceae bacterium]|nr:alpha/beta hydrolase [Erysipelotrichaceae bacterium]
MWKEIVRLITRHEGARWAANDAVRDAGLTDPEDVEIFDDINYGDGSQANLLAVHLPRGTGHKLPCIMDVHGGGWFYGSKDLYRHYCSHLAQHGFAVVNFNYHLMPDYLFPRALEDTNLVMKWVAENHEKYFIDPDNVFVVGDSAGAQIGSQYVTVWASEEYAKLFDFVIPREITIRGFVGNCGVYDVPNGAISRMLKYYFGRDYRQKNPRLDMFRFVTSAFPPSYIMTAVRDQARPEAEPFAEVLRKAGVPVILKVYGEPDDEAAVHVFHENIRHPLAIQCNNDECRFMKELVK